MERTLKALGPALGGRALLFACCAWLAAFAVRLTDHFHLDGAILMHIYPLGFFAVLTLCTAAIVYAREARRGPADVVTFWFNAQALNAVKAVRDASIQIHGPSPARARANLARVLTLLACLGSLGMFVMAYGALLSPLGNMR